MISIQELENGICWSYYILLGVYTSPIIWVHRDTLALSMFLLYIEIKHKWINEKNVVSYRKISDTRQQQRKDDIGDNVPFYYNH